MVRTQKISLTPGSTATFGKAEAIRITPFAIVEAGLTSAVPDTLTTGRALIFTANTDAAQTVMGIDARGIGWTRGPFFGAMIRNDAGYEIMLDVEISTERDDPLPDERPPLSFLRRFTDTGAWTVRIFAPRRARVAVGFDCVSSAGSPCSVQGQMDQEAAIYGSNAPGMGKTITIGTGIDRQCYFVFGSDAANVTVSAPPDYRRECYPAPVPPIILANLGADAGATQRVIGAWGV